MKRITALVSKSTNNISLIQGNDYQVIGIREKFFHIVDEAGEPTLYPKSYFSGFVETVPSGWMFHHFECGDYICYPQELSSRGFFERYDDGHQKEIEVFKKYLSSAIDCD